MGECREGVEADENGVADDAEAAAMADEMHPDPMPPTELPPSPLGINPPPPEHDRDVPTNPLWPKL